MHPPRNPNDSAETGAPTISPLTASDPESADRPGGEAARYRRRLRDTEVERDALRDQLAAAHTRLSGIERTAVRQLAGASLVNPDDLATLGGLDLDDLPRDEAGELDTAAVLAAIDTLAAARPELTLAGAARALPRRGPTPLGQGDRMPIQTSMSEWKDILHTRG